MLTKSITKKKNLALYAIYTAVQRKEYLTVSQISETFKKDSEEWLNGHQTDINTLLHAYLANLFVGDTDVLKSNADVTYIRRKKNTNNIWTYGINLEDPQFLKDVLSDIYDFLIQVELTTLVDDENNIMERSIPGNTDMYLHHKKIYYLVNFYEQVTGEIFAPSIIHFD